MVIYIILVDRLGNFSATQTLKQLPNFRTNGQAFIVHLVSLTHNILAQDLTKITLVFLLKFLLIKLSFLLTSQQSLPIELCRQRCTTRPRIKYLNKLPLRFIKLEKKKLIVRRAPDSEPVLRLKGLPRRNLTSDYLREEFRAHLEVPRLFSDRCVGFITIPSIDLELR